MKLDTPFNTNELPIDEPRTFGAIPADDYAVRITSAEVKPTKAGTGQYINLRLDVIEGQYAKRVVFALINIKNPSSDAERIGRAQLGSILLACGIPTLHDTDQLLGHELIVKVGLREYNGEMQNDVKAFKSSRPSFPAMAIPPAAPTPAAPVVNDPSKPFWAQK